MGGYLWIHHPHQCNRMPSETLITGTSGQYCFSVAADQLPLRSKGMVNRVFKGQRKSDGRPVTIKQLHPRQAERPGTVAEFLAEKDRTPNHPFVPPMLDIVQRDNHVFLIRDFVEGQPSGDWLKRIGKRHRLVKSVHLAIACLDILEAAHKQGKLHADLRPDNVVVNASEQPYLLDWGQGFSWPPKEGELPRGKAFSMIYSPPEQVLGMRSVLSPATDVYSLSLTLYEWITGRSPFGHGHPAKLINMQLASPFPSTDDLPKELGLLLVRAGAKPSFPKPPTLLPRKTVRLLVENAMAERFSSAAAFAQALRDWLADFQPVKRGFWERLVSPQH